MLHSIFYAEFDNTLGPVVLFDAPKGSVSDTVGGACLFDAISDYSITGPQLSGHLITVSVPNSAFGEIPENASTSYQQLNKQSLSEHQSSFNARQNTRQNDDGGNGVENNQDDASESEMRVVNFPLAIGSHEAKRHYHRNALLFNVGFVVRQNVAAELFSASLRRLALTLRAMEIESAFLSNAESKATLNRLLPKLLDDLNQFGESTVVLDKANILSLKLPSPYPVTKAFLGSNPNLAQTNPSIPPLGPYGGEEEEEAFFIGEHDVSFEQPPPPPPMIPLPDQYKEERLFPEICEHHVPALLLPRSQLLSLDWDLTVLKVLPFIDGVRCIKLIRIEAQMDFECCREAIAVLLWHEGCALVDIFRYSNIYALRPGVKNLFGSITYKNEQTVAGEWGLETIAFIANLSVRRKGKQKEMGGDSGSDSGQENYHDGKHMCNGDEEEEEGTDVIDAIPAPIPYGQVLSCACDAALGRHSRLCTGPGGSLRSSTNKQLPHEVLNFFLCFGAGLSVKEVVGASVSYEKFDHRQLLAFALMNGLVQRIHVYPVCELPIEELTSVASLVADAFIEKSPKLLPEPLPATTRGSTSFSPTTATTPTSAKKQQHVQASQHHNMIQLFGPSLSKNNFSFEVIAKFLEMMDGSHSMDAIGCQLLLSETQMNQIVEQVNNSAVTNQDAICFLFK